MGNCLKTQLKGNVNNDDLKYFGSAEIWVNIPEGTDYNANNFYSFWVPMGTKLRIVGDGYFRASATSSESIGKEITVDIESGSYNVFPSIGEYVILYSKYGNRKTVGNGSVNASCTMKVEFYPQYADASIIDTVNILPNRLANSFTCEDLTQLTSLRTIQISTTSKFSGNIVSLGVLTSLNVLEINDDPNLEGSVSDLLDALKENGKRGDIRIAVTAAVNPIPPGAGWNTTYTITDDGWSIKS